MIQFEEIVARMRRTLSAASSSAQTHACGVYLAGRVAVKLTRNLHNERWLVLD